MIYILPPSPRWPPIRCSAHCLSVTEVSLRKLLFSGVGVGGVDPFGGRIRFVLLLRTDGSARDPRNMSDAGRATPPISRCNNCQRNRAACQKTKQSPPSLITWHFFKVRRQTNERRNIRYYLTGGQTEEWLNNPVASSPFWQMVAL